MEFLLRDSLPWYPTREFHPLPGNHQGLLEDFCGSTCYLALPLSKTGFTHQLFDFLAVARKTKLEAKGIITWKFTLRTQWGKLRGWDFSLRV